MTLNSKHLLVVVGPTAVGKTAKAIEWALALNTEIISCDSRQFYKELKIGTAAPSEEELNAVKHHFIGHLSIADYYNVSRFEHEAIQCIEQLFTTKDVVVMVGGSGLYIDALCNGIDDLPDPDEQLRNKIQAEFEYNGIEYLQEQLKLLDPEYYNQVDLQNPNRLKRAIEVCLTTGKTYTSLRNNTSKPRNFQIHKIGLQKDRQALNEIINRRVDKMIEEGLLEEAKTFYPQKHLNALNTVGYKELFMYFDGLISLEQAIENIKTNTRRYAKRQMTWFKRYPEIKWINPQEYLDINDCY